jgi:hypothetical protein
LLEILEYPRWSSLSLLPFFTLFEKRICEDDDVSHKGAEGLLWCLSCLDGQLIFFTLKSALKQTATKAGM